jgi:hypothetical protein
MVATSRAMRTDQPLRRRLHPGLLAVRPGSGRALDHLDQPHLHLFQFGPQGVERGACATWGVQQIVRIQQTVSRAIGELRRAPPCVHA